MMSSIQPSQIFSIKTTYSPSSINESSFAQIGQNWCMSQGKHWPSELTGNVVTKNLKLLHYPHWVVSGNGAALWDGSVGRNYNEVELCSRCSGRGSIVIGSSRSTCSKCNGSGKVNVTKTLWRREQGTVLAKVQGRVIENFSSAVKCGDRVLSANEYVTDSNALSIVPPSGSTPSHAIEVAKNTVMGDLKRNAEKIARGMGDQARDVNVLNANLTELDTRVWLYPIYEGYYSHEGENLPVQIDGISGVIWAKLPTVVKDGRLREARRNWFVTLLVIGAVISYFSLSSSRNVTAQNWMIAGGVTLAVSWFITWCIVLPTMRAIQKNK